MLYYNNVANKTIYYYERNIDMDINEFNTFDDFLIDNGKVAKYVQNAVDNDNVKKAFTKLLDIAEPCPQTQHILYHYVVEYKVKDVQSELKESFVAWFAENVVPYFSDVEDKEEFEKDNWQFIVNQYNWKPKNQLP